MCAINRARRHSACFLEKCETMASQEVVDAKVKDVFVRERIRGGMTRVAAVFAITRLATYAQHGVSVTPYVAGARAEVAEAVLQWARAMQFNMSATRQEAARSNLEHKWHNFVVRITAMLVPELFAELIPREHDHDSRMPRWSKDEHRAVVSASHSLVNNAAYDIGAIAQGVIKLDLGGGKSNHEYVQRAMLALRIPDTPDKPKDHREETAALYVEHMSGKYLSDTLDWFAERANNKINMVGALMDRLVCELELQALRLALGQHEETYKIMRH